MSDTTPPAKPARKPAASKLPTVEQAWSDVMGAVRVIEKSERNKAQGFSFRGIDTVVNAVGPQLREHRVIVIPSAEEITQTTYQTSKGTQMVNTVVKMRYTIHGPQPGDTLEGSAYGEASDAGDKSVSKAESVAWRMFLLQSLAIPTDEADPDYDVDDRAEPAVDPNMVTWWNDLASRSGNLPDEQKKKAREWVKDNVPNKAASLTDELIDEWSDLINDLLAEAHEAQAIPDPEPTPDPEGLLTMPFIQNVVTLVGNITRDPEIRYTPAGKAVADFGIAHNTRQKNQSSGEWEDGPTSFFDVTCWDQRAENASESLVKGTKVIVVGELRQDSWTDKESGDKRSKVKVIASTVGPALDFATAEVVKNERTTEAKPARSQGSVRRPQPTPDYGEEPF